jgi:hypothetical protein
MRLAYARCSHGHNPSRFRKSCALFARIPKGVCPDNSFKCVQTLRFHCICYSKWWFAATISRFTLKGECVAYRADRNDVTHKMAFTLLLGSVCYAGGVAVTITHAKSSLIATASCTTGWLTVVLHSLRNTFIGSTFVARRAGRKQATSDMQINKSVIATNVSGSTGLMPKSISRRRRVEATAPINPSAMPMSVNFIPRRRTRLSMSPVRAPSAIRMPSSCLRCVTA